MRQGLAAYRDTGFELMWPYYLALLTEAYGKVGKSDDGLFLIAEALAKYIFKHALTQDVAYQSVLIQRRRALHGIVGTAIEELYRDRLAEQDLDGLLLFKIEDMYWLCGFESDGFCIFHNMFIGTNGALTHVARPVDLANIAYSSICEDVRVSPDSEQVKRASSIKDMLASHGMQGKRIGIQVDTMGLTPRLFLEIGDTLDAWCDLVVVDDFIRELRMVKSAQELAYFRKAGKIMDTVMARVVEATYPGAYEGDIYATFLALCLAAPLAAQAALPPDVTQRLQTAAYESRAFDQRSSPPRRGGPSGAPRCSTARRC